MNHLYKNLGQITLNLILKQEIKMRIATVIKMLQMLFTKYLAKKILDPCTATEWKITQELLWKSLHSLWKPSHSSNSWLKNGYVFSGSAVPGIRCWVHSPHILPEAS